MNGRTFSQNPRRRGKCHHHHHQFQKRVSLSSGWSFSPLYHKVELTLWFFSSNKHPLLPNPTTGLSSLITYLQFPTFQTSKVILILMIWGLQALPLRHKPLGAREIWAGQKNKVQFLWFASFGGTELPLYLSKQQEWAGEINLFSFHIWSRSPGCASTVMIVFPDQC